LFANSDALQRRALRVTKYAALSCEVVFGGVAKATELHRSSFGWDGWGHLLTLPAEVRRAARIMTAAAPAFATALTAMGMT